MKHLLPGLFLAAALLSGCGKSTDPTPPPPVVNPPATPAATGTYTDPAGNAFVLAGLQAKVTAAAPASSGAAQQGIVVNGTLPDGQVVRVGYIVAQSAMPASAGTLTLGSTLPYIGGPAAAGATTVGYSSVGKTTGSVALESATPVLLSGSFSGPLLPAGTVPANPPLAHVTFAHVAVTP